MKESERAVWVKVKFTTAVNERLYDLAVKRGKSVANLVVDIVEHALKSAPEESAG